MGYVYPLWILCLTKTINMKIGELVLAASLLFLPANANTSLQNSNARANEQAAMLKSAIEEDSEIVSYLKTLIVSTKTKLTMADIFQYEHRQIIRNIAYELGVEPVYLYKLIYDESKGDTKAYNKRSGATGIIQWIPSTARKYGTTTKSISKMSLTGQLYLARLYFKDTFPKNYKTYHNLRLAVLCPMAIGKSNHYVIADSTTNYGRKVLKYYQDTNDVNQDGVITVEELLYKKNTQSTAKKVSVDRLDTDSITNV